MEDLSFVALLLSNAPKDVAFAALVKYNVPLFKYIAPLFVYIDSKDTSSAVLLLYNAVRDVFIAALDKHIAPLFGYIGSKDVSFEPMYVCITTLHNTNATMYLCNTAFF